MTKHTTSSDKSNTHGTKKSSNPKEHIFEYDDRRYIDRDQLYVIHTSQAILTQEVEELNCGKVGRPPIFTTKAVAGCRNMGLIV